MANCDYKHVDVAVSSKPSNKNMHATCVVHSPQHNTKAIHRTIVPLCTYKKDAHMLEHQHYPALMRELRCWS